LTPHLRAVGWTTVGVALAAIFLATLTPAPGELVGSRLCVVCGSMGGVDVILNVLLFVPLGIGMAMAGTSAKRAVVAALGISLLVETAQLFIPGRDSSLGDLITNTIGGALGYALFRNAALWLAPSPRRATSLTLSWCAVWLAIQSVSSFALAPKFPDSPYFGQIAPRLGNYELFRGRVLEAQIDQTPVADTRFRPADSVAYRLRAGAAISATVVPLDPTIDVAPIIRVADADQDEIALLGQWGTSLAFRVATGADILRLRSPVFGLRLVFPDRQQRSAVIGAGTVGLRGEYRRGEVRLTARNASGTISSLMGVTSSMGWTLLLPFRWSMDGRPTQRVISWLWVALLLMPLGFWCGSAYGNSRLQHIRGATKLALVAALATICIGLIWEPHAFGLAATPMGDWLAAFAGVSCGAAFSSALARQRHGRPAVL
jgi:hypothetical protein